MGNSISRLLNRSGALLILLAVTFGAIVLVALPAHRMLGDLQRELIHKSDQVMHLQAMLQRGPEAERLREIARVRLKEAGFLSGATESLRAAALQSHVGQIARQAGIRVRSSRGLASRPNGRLEFIGLRIEFMSELDALQSFIAQAEAARPRLVVESMQIMPVTFANDAGRKLEVGIELRAAVLVGETG